MKFKEFVNLIDDKIDYLFRRGKNADERCYDYFIRTVTFFVVVLIVLCYASFAHASENYGTFFGGVQYDYFLKFEDVYNHYLDYDRQNTDFSMPDSGVGFIMSNPYSVGPFTTEESFNNVVNFVDTNYAISGNEEFQYSYTVLQRRDSWSNSGNSEFTITKIYSNSKAFLIVNSWDAATSSAYYVIANEDNSDMYARTFSINYISNSSYHVNINSESTSKQITLNPQGQCALYFVDMPIYHLRYSNSGRQGDYTYKTLDSMINAIRSGDVNIQLNPYLDVLDPSEPEEPEVESNANHMYAELFNVYITGEPSTKLYSNYDLLFDIQVDEWVVEHINDYKLNINYQFVFTGNYIKDYNIVAQSTESLNLRTIVNTPYKKSLFTLFNEMKADGRSVNAYLSEISSASDMYLMSKADTFIEKKIYSIFEQSFLYNIGAIYFQNNESAVNIGNSYLVVSCWLSTDEYESQTFNKTFDFKNGTENVTNDGIMNNPNPWIDPDNPEQPEQKLVTDNSVNTGGGSIAYGGNSYNNINISTGNGYQDTELHQLTEEDIKENHRNIIRTIETLRDVFQRFADVTNDEEHQSFLQMIYTEFYQIPGLPYMVLSVIVVFGIMVIIFIIKIAF